MFEEGSFRRRPRGFRRKALKSPYATASIYPGPAVAAAAAAAVAHQQQQQHQPPSSSAALLTDPAVTAAISGGRVAYDASLASDYSLASQNMSAASQATPPPSYYPYGNNNNNGYGCAPLSYGYAGSPSSGADYLYGVDRDVYSMVPPPSSSARSGDLTATSYASSLPACTQTTTFHRDSPPAALPTSPEQSTPPSWSTSWSVPLSSSEASQHHTYAPASLPPLDNDVYRANGSKPMTPVYLEPKTEPYLPHHYHVGFQTANHLQLEDQKPPAELVNEIKPPEEARSGEESSPARYPEPEAPPEYPQPEQQQQQPLAVAVAVAPQSYIVGEG